MALGFPTRRSGQKTERDKLCLNMWLDESYLAWSPKDRNVYTAHEIAQIVPLVNKDKTDKRFIAANLWIKQFWPNAVPKEGVKKQPEKKQGPFFKLIEAVAYSAQLKYMKSKITREVVTPTRAVFHPYDWSEVILGRLQENG
jgi:D-beta-D-heptose 7-phosphate kinase/D-beta-D-heptose 1-phosphate adenosyltransferase